MEIREQGTALAEHLPSTELVESLIGKFNIEKEAALMCLKGIVGHKKNLEKGLWSLYEKHEEFFLIREDKGGEKSGGVYRIYTTVGKRFDKITQGMVETVYLQYERTHLEPAAFNVGSSAGNNETGHYLPPSKSGRR